jgi:hypothetical protein
MRHTAYITSLAACALLAACGGAPAPVASNRNANSQSSGNAQTSVAHGPSAEVAPAHGGAPQSNSGAGSSSTKPPVETPDLDSKIEKAEAKAKASGAGEADRKAAARAYFDRADFFRDQGSPVLYKFALADYRRGLRYDSTDAEARRKMDEIVDIYKSMGRPVPDLGNEPDEGKKQ